jgi:hypothetical protein
MGSWGSLDIDPLSLSQLFGVSLSMLFGVLPAVYGRDSWFPESLRELALDRLSFAPAPLEQMVDYVFLNTLEATPGDPLQTRRIPQ